MTVLYHNIKCYQKIPNANANTLGTTSVTLLAASLLHEIKNFVEEGVSPEVIIKGFRKASVLAVGRIKEICVSVERSGDERYSKNILEACRKNANLEGIGLRCFTPY
jgi:chaperonin GroEL (HSP60 family)